MAAAELNIRQAETRDRASIIELCRASLGWRDGEPNEAFFEWKHDHNAFGASPSWVAETDDGRIAGLRVFLRWRFRGPDGGVLRAVRAVDTATHPDFQGQGIFTKLTLGALPELREMGTHFVFNTPNDKSRPGYLKMGWGQVGRVPVGVRVAGLKHVRSVLGANAPAEKWSSPTSVGEAPGDAFGDDAGVESLLRRGGRSASDPGRIATDRDAAHLRWRYSFEPLHYRVMPVGSSVRDGVVVFRLRRRGDALEATIVEMLVASPSAARATIGRILRETGADYAIAAGGTSLIGAGFVPVRRLGPILTWKPIDRLGVPRMSELALALGDVELF